MRGVNTARPSERLADLIRPITSGSSASSPAETTTAIVETKTSRAAKLLKTPIVSCQSYPSGSNTGCANLPILPSNLFSSS